MFHCSELFRKFIDYIHSSRIEYIAHDEPVIILMFEK